MLLQHGVNVLSWEQCALSGRWMPLIKQLEPSFTAGSASPLQRKLCGQHDSMWRTQDGLGAAPRALSGRWMPSKMVLSRPGPSFHA